MDQQELKKAVGQAALQYVKPGEILGVGTGSTVDCFIDALKESGISVPACVSSSVRSTNKLQAYGFKVLDLNEVEKISVYVDGADEIDPHFAMIKGGGGALTREKIVAMVSERFVCIADESKKVDVLGKFPLPIEVIPMAVNAVAREIEKLGGRPVLRDFTTDNGTGRNSQRTYRQSGGPFCCFGRNWIKEMAVSAITFGIFRKIFHFFSIQRWDFMLYLQYMICRFLLCERGTYAISKKIRPARRGELCGWRSF